MDWIKQMAKKLIITVLGVVVMLAWWSWRGKQSDPNHTYSENQIPAQVWEGGSQQLHVEVNATVAALLRLSLEAPLPDNAEASRWHEAWQEVDPGQHSFSVQFPESTSSGMVEFNAKDPKVGDKISWTVKLNDQIIQEDSMTLEKPLEAGTAMFLQIELEEFLAPQPNS